MRAQPTRSRRRTASRSSRSTSSRPSPRPRSSRRVPSQPMGPKAGILAPARRAGYRDAGFMLGQSVHGGFECAAARVPQLVRGRSRRPASPTRKGFAQPAMPRLSSSAPRARKRRPSCSPSRTLPYAACNRTLCYQRPLSRLSARLIPSISTARLRCLSGRTQQYARHLVRMPCQSCAASLSVSSPCGCHALGPYRRAAAAVRAHV
jgi:hypothetical protein